MCELLTYVMHGRTGGASMVPSRKNDRSVLRDIRLGVEMLMGFDVDERALQWTWLL